MRRLLLAALVTAAGCTIPAASVPNTSTVGYLVTSSPEAALDAVAAWAAQADDLGVDRVAEGMAIRDRRSGQDNVATLTARARPDGLTEVTVSSRYLVRPSFRDLGVAAYLGQGEAAFALPRPGSPSCFSLDDWRARQDAPAEEPEPVEEDEPVEETSPELIGGLGGLQARLAYPEAMRRAGVEGAVLVQFFVGETGAVECAEVVSSPHPEFSASARAAVLASAFTPGTREGVPVRVRFTLPLTFALR